MPAERIVYIVDDDDAVRRSLERLLDVAGFRTVSYGTPFAFLSVVETMPAGCALIDIRMTGMSGLELQERLLQIKLTLPVIIMTGHGDIQSAVRAMKSGAVDFIEKPYSDDHLIESVETALRRFGEGNRAIEVSDAAARIADLTPREREVLDALVQGRPNKVIALDLGISVRTVEVHRARMMDRLGVQQFAEAVRLAVLAQLGSSG
jgi:two-component system response regulator FixJ